MPNIQTVLLADDPHPQFRSRHSILVHLLIGKPMIWYACEAARQASGDAPILVNGHAIEEVRQAMGNTIEYALQEQQVGVLQAIQALSGEAELIVVMPANMPLMTVESLKQLTAAQRNHHGPLTMLAMRSNDPQASQAQELNANVYCFNASWLCSALRSALPRFPTTPSEVSLAAVVGLARSAGLSIQTLTLAEASEAMVVNDFFQLSQAEALMRTRINHAWMRQGVRLMDPASTYIEPDVAIGQDTLIWPNTYLRGNTRIGEQCELGPNSIIQDTAIGNRCKVLASVLEGAILEDDVDVGPFGHLRKGAHLAQGVHMGNFGEVKDSYLGPGTKMGHFSYIGNATIGANVNIGAGTITCNYDGKKKYPTEIGENAFIGSDTMLIAPVKIGNGARTGAGAVVTRDVSAKTLAVGMPARAIRKLAENE